MDLTHLTISDLKEHVHARVSAVLAEKEYPDITGLVLPPNPAMGDLGFPCFPFARIARKAPPQIAADLASAFEPDELLEEISAEGPYVNFRFRPEALSLVVVGEALRQADLFGADGVKNSEHWMLEYSAPNTNKPQHLGHIRNNVLGYATSRILQHVGHRVTRVNLINDRGIHICKSMLAYQRLAEGATPESTGTKGDHFVGKYYVRFEAEFRKEYAEWLKTDGADTAFVGWGESRNGMTAHKAFQAGKGPEPRGVFESDYKANFFNDASEWGAAAKAMLLAWEAGDEGVVSLWKEMNQWVFDGFDKTYSRLGVSFEKVYYESNTYLQGKDIVAQGVEDGVFQTLDDGAVVFDLEKIGKTGRKVLLRGDGTSVYMTQDLGTALQRFDEFGMDRMAYVVADEQAYHFEVLFGVLGTLRENLKGAFTHLSYGMVHLPEGKMKSREGKVVDADDLMNGMAELAAGEIRNREEEAASRGETPLTDAEIMARAESIGLAALKYYLLSFTPGATITFDPKKSIDFLGQTGPYCLYAYARVQSLLRRAGDGLEDREWNTELANLLTSPLEQAVIRALQAVPSTFLAAAETVDTSKIADQTYKVAKSFSTLYNDRNHQIVGNKNAELGAARLFLARSVAHAIKAGLSVLGIDTVDKM